MKQLEDEKSSGASQGGPRRSRAASAGVVGAALALIAGTAFFTGVVQAPGGALKPPRTTDEVPVTPMHLTVEPSNNSPLLAADPTESRFVVMANRMDAPDFSCALQVSGDGGASWAPVNPVTELPAGADKCYAPEVAFDSEGVLHYLFVGLKGAGNEPMGAFLTSSPDRGRTFSPPDEVLGPLNFGVRMAIDRGAGAQGRMHLVWIHATSDPPLGGFGPPPNPILAAYSDDLGKTFSDPVQVSDPDRPMVVAPALTLGGDDAVHVAYYDLKGDVPDYQGLEGPVWPESWALVVASSGDGGQSFGRGVVADDEVQPFERVMLIFTMTPPSLVADGRRLCLAWADGRNGDPDVLVRCSPSAGRTWGAAVRVNDDPIGNGKRQYLPRLGVAPDGRMDAIFYDRRSDLENVLNHVSYTFSTDHGKTFRPNITLTRWPSNSRVGQQYVGAAAEGQFEIGNRLGLLSRSDGAVAAWADMRNSFPQSTSQDIFAARVVFPSRDQPGWARIVGAGLVALGVLTASVAAVHRRRARRSREEATGSDG